MPQDCWRGMANQMADFELLVGTRVLIDTIGSPLTFCASSHTIDWFEWYLFSFSLSRLFSSYVLFFCVCLLSCWQKYLPTKDCDEADEKLDPWCSLRKRPQSGIGRDWVPYGSHLMVSYTPSLFQTLSFLQTWRLRDWWFLEIRVVQSPHLPPNFSGWSCMFALFVSNISQSWLALIGIQ